MAATNRTNDRAIVNPCEGVEATKHLLLATRPSTNEDGRRSTASRMADNGESLSSRGRVLSGRNWRTANQMGTKSGCWRMIRDAEESLEKPKNESGFILNGEV